eukprot:comp19751_c0_seq1/m.23592 comp19751_c0_seq1/g.23592  ORF comp19751_c0_seq1/g.23592 comp19751_c0_seq1/m.23592 type:complete len:140 (-) comp19751_c0_seq1:547-966(-)
MAQAPFNGFNPTPGFPTSMTPPPGGMGSVPGTPANYNMGSPGGSDSADPRKDKRAHHTALERKRRDHIKDKFAILHQEIPGISSQDKASRSLILSKATEYIQEMTQANEQVLAEVEELKRQNAMLHEQIRKLEAQQAGK